MAAQDRQTAQVMSGGEAVVESLIDHGVDTVFGIPGIQLDPLFDGFYNKSNQVRVIHNRHEQGSAYMAFGYAKSTGRTGVYSVVPGPGVLNTTAALCTAHSAPVLCLTGQIPSEFIGAGHGMLHELPDQLATLRTLTKWAARINHPAEAPSIMSRLRSPKTSASADASSFTIASGPYATWCKTTCCNSCALLPWSHRRACITMPCATKRSRYCRHFIRSRKTTYGA